MIDLKEIPLFYKTHNDKNNGGLPQTFPFNIYFDNELGIIRQKNTPELEKILNEIYIQGSLVEGSISSESGQVYINEIINFITKNIPNLSETEVIEIGCGKGNLLKILQPKVKSILGLEPGLHGVVDGIEGIEIINDFFPSIKIIKKFDLIYHFGVLEHILNPLDFLQNQKNNLKKNGYIVIAIPNCEPYYKEGDISMFIHEHYNYFNRHSLQTIANKLKLKIVEMKIVEGMIFCCMHQADLFELNKKKYDELNFIEFENKINLFSRKIKSIFENNKNKKIGIYIPGRALNILQTLNINNCRIFDDSSELHNKFLPYLKCKIENFKELLNDPTDIIIIFSNTFSNRIIEKCKQYSELNASIIISIYD